MDEPPICLVDLERPTWALARRAVEGLPVSVLDELAAAMAPGDLGFVHRIVPRTSLGRQRETGRLTPEQSDQVVHLARLWFLACRVWHVPALARRMLRGENRPNAAPLLDLALSSAIGLQVAMDTIACERFGVVR